MKGGGYTARATRHSPLRCDQNREERIKNAFRGHTQVGTRNKDRASRVEAESRNPPASERRYLTSQVTSHLTVDEFTLSFESSIDTSVSANNRQCQNLR